MARAALRSTTAARATRLEPVRGWPKEMTSVCLRAHVRTHNHRACVSIDDPGREQVARGMGWPTKAWRLLTWACSWLQDGQSARKVRCAGTMSLQRKARLGQLFGDDLVAELDALVAMLRVTRRFHGRD